jgi:hypothetical protein
MRIPTKAMGMTTLTATTTDPTTMTMPAMNANPTTTPTDLQYIPAP